MRVHTLLVPVVLEVRFFLWSIIYIICGICLSYGESSFILMQILLSGVVKFHDIFIFRVHFVQMHIRLSSCTDGLQDFDILLVNGLAWDNFPYEIVKAWVTIKFGLNQSA